MSRTVPRVRTGLLWPGYTLARAGPCAHCGGPASSAGGSPHPRAAGFFSAAADLAPDGLSPAVLGQA